jgi:CRP-like cAMP-binding protein
MPIWFKVVKESVDIEKVCRLRHTVFVKEEKRFSYHSSHVVDLFDTFKETINVLALKENEPIGTIRVVMPNPVGLPALEHYNFQPFIDTLSGECSCFGWLCILKAYRTYPGLLFGLFKMAFRELRKNGMHHIVATLHPPLMHLLQRSFNAKRLGDDFESGELKVPMTPAYIDTNNVPPRSREIFHDPTRVFFNDANIRRIYQQGEPIITKGDVGDEAFLIIRGSVRALPEDCNAHMLISRQDNYHYLGKGDILFGPGEVFGELALLDQGVRSTTVVPYSNEVDLMVWKKNEFLEQLSTNKEAAVNICKFLGERLRKQIAGNQEIGFVKDSEIARVLYDASNEGEHAVDAVWLGRQCGIWPKKLMERIDRWGQQSMISHTESGITLLNASAIDAIGKTGQ